MNTTGQTILSPPATKTEGYPSTTAIPQTSTCEVHVGAYVCKAPTRVMESMNSFTGSEALTLLSQGSNRLSPYT